MTKNPTMTVQADAMAADLQLALEMARMSPGYDDPENRAAVERAARVVGALSAVPVVVVHYETPQGAEGMAFLSAEAAEEHRQTLAATHWESKIGDTMERPTDPKALADAYFEHMGEATGRWEYWTETPATLNVLSSDFLAQPPAAQPSHFPESDGPDFEP